jgi:glutamine phosphoribosylpyrophosphate amidotransferase
MKEPTKKQEKVAVKISKYLEKVCKQEGCDIGIWLSWDDLLRAVDTMKKNPQFTEIKGEIQIRWSDNGSNDTDQADDASGAGHRASCE